MCAAPEDVAAGDVPEHPEALVAELRRSRVTAAGIPARVVPGSEAGPVEVEAPADDTVQDRVLDLLGGHSLAWVFDHPAAST
jgi:hypothetical protein